MPLYIGDYLADTSRLTTEQHGAYLLLLMDYWRHGPPPDDPAVLAQIAKLSQTVWQTHSSAIGHFFKIQHGVWIHSRVEAERSKAEGISETRQSAGRRGAKTRWGDGKQDDKPIANAMANAMANGLQTGSQTAWQIDRPSHKEKEKETETEQEKEQRLDREKPPIAPLRGGRRSNGSVSGFSRFDAFWAAYPKKIGKDAAAKSFEKRSVDDALLATMLAKIEEWRTTEDWTKERGKYIPNPATWLNQGRWQDEAQVRRGIGGSDGNVAL